MRPMLAYEPQNPATDIHGARYVTIRVRRDGGVIWILDAIGTRLRICNIEGPVTIQDDRIEEGAS